MRSRRTVLTDKVYRLPGGTEDNDLWTYEIDEPDEPAKIICSVWVPTTEERLAIAQGANIRLCVWGGQPPVAIDLTTEEVKGAERGG